MEKINIEEIIHQHDLGVRFKNHFEVIGALNSEMYRLGGLMGLKPPTPALNLDSVITKIKALRAKLAASPTTFQTPKPAAASEANQITPPAPPPAAKTESVLIQPEANASLEKLPPNVKPVAEYLKLSVADRKQFCTDGCQLSYTDFNTLNPAQKSQFSVSGGTIYDNRKRVEKSIYGGGQYRD